MQQILSFVQKANGYLADYILVILLIGVGLYFTIRTKFVQVRCFGEGMKNVFGKISLRGGKQKGGLSSFQALATAVAAQVGTGNIVGASGAILVGGPGAIFWMWIIAFLGMATIYAEATLAQHTKVVDNNGEVHGGPVYYIKTVFKGKFGSFLAGFFAIAITLALGFMGSMVQSNSIAESCNTAFGIPGWVIGLIVAAISAFIFIGGIQRIASVTEKLVPLMAVIFLAGGLVVLACRITYIPETFGMIFKYAFTPNALLGGGIGAAIKAAISQGAKRGLFSNEAGMGSTPHAHAMANVEKPHDQGVVAMIGVFVDTFVVLTMTALVVISTLYTGNGILADKTDASYNVATSGYTFALDSENATVYEENGVVYIKDAEYSYNTDTRTFTDINGENEGKEFTLDQKTVADFEYADTDTAKENPLKYVVKPVITKTNAMQTAFTGVFSSFGNFGSIFVAICLLFFAFSTIISWNFFGKLNVQYLFKNSKVATLIYSVVAIVFIFLGSLLSNDLVWELTDFFNYLMVLPNAIALLALGSIVAGFAKNSKKK